MRWQMTLQFNNDQAPFLSTVVCVFDAKHYDGVKFYYQIQLHWYLDYIITTKFKCNRQSLIKTGCVALHSPPKKKEKKEKGKKKKY